MLFKINNVYSLYSLQRGKKYIQLPDSENRPRKMESAHEVLNTSSLKCSNRDNCRRPTAVRKKPWIKWAPKDATSTAHDHPRSGLVAKPLDIGCSFGYYSIYPIKLGYQTLQSKQVKYIQIERYGLVSLFPALGREDL